MLLFFAIKVVLLLMWIVTKRPEQKYYYPAVPVLLPRPCRQLLIVSWVFILWAHTRLWCILYCHFAGKIFILLVLFLICAAMEGWCITQKPPQKQCMTVYSKTLYASKWNIILIDTVVCSPDSLPQSCLGEGAVRRRLVYTTNTKLQTYSFSIHGP